ncbi:hypothetical protein SFRURICE_001677 [Spodoptera frugiperda]|nr:hypothetical protein SFRURICE_001677 [Spodoptera frugiperda]
MCRAMCRAMFRVAGRAPALLLLLAAAAALAADAADAADHFSPNCAKLHKHGIKQEWQRIGSLRERARVRPLQLYWGSAAGHAASALLLVLLRHLYSYDSLELIEGPLSTTQLAEKLPQKGDHSYKTYVLKLAISKSNSFSPIVIIYKNNIGLIRYEIGIRSKFYVVFKMFDSRWVIALSTAWVPGPIKPWVEGSGSNGGLAGPRLAEFGASPVSARRRLFVWLAPHVRAFNDCMTMQWPFDVNETTRLHCGFIDPKVPRDNSTVEVLSIDDSATLDQLLKRARAAESPLLARQVNYTVFFNTLRTANHSFLFLDFDIWSGEPGVRAIEPPPCMYGGSTSCVRELDSAISLRVADVEKLQVYAPLLFMFVHDFDPPPEALRYILEKEASGTNIEEAACAWVDKKKVHYYNHTNREKYSTINNTVVIYMCDYYGVSYDNLFKDVNRFLEKQQMNIGLYRFYVNCSDNYDMSQRLSDLTGLMIINRMLGVVSLAPDGALQTSAVAAANKVPLLLVDVAPDVAPEDSCSAAAGTTWWVAGSPRHLARALAHFVLAAGWKRLAVISDDTLLAQQYNAAVKLNTTIVSREFHVNTGLTDNDIHRTLDDLRATKARIIFINANAGSATAIFEAAVQRRMTFSKGFIWIMRDWEQHNKTVCNSEKHFTVSFWNHSPSNERNNDNSATVPDRILKKHKSLPRAAACINAYLTLVLGFNNFSRSGLYRDLRNDFVIKSFNESVVKSPVTGVPHSHPLRYKNRVLEDTYVYIEEWCGGQVSRRLATWRVNVTSGAVRQWGASDVADLPHDDGTSSCWITSGDPFDPVCYDVAVACVLLLLPLMLVAVLLLCWQRTAERRPSATELAAYLAAWPRALHPVLTDERDADSGFGESPSTELLPPESPAHTHDQLDILAATP